MEQNNLKYYNLTHPQKRIWYIDKINESSQLHNIGGGLIIDGKIDIDKMRQSINHVIEKNDGLRLQFTENNGVPVQYVADYMEEKIEFRDFSYNTDPEEEQRRWSTELFHKQFELIENKLYHFALYKINDNKYGVLLIVHHIIADGWSINLIEKQVCENYKQLVDCKELDVEEKSSYLDYIEHESNYLNSERFIKNKNYWNKRFESPSVDFLYKSTNSLEGNRLSFDIDSIVTGNIKKYITDKKYSLNTFFISMLLIYVNKTVDKDDITIGTAIYNRANKSQKNMIGMFTSTVPLRFSMTSSESVEELLEQVNRELKYSFLNQRYPYDLLVKDLELKKNGYDSLFKMCVNYYNKKYVNEVDDLRADLEEYYCGNQSYSLQLTVKEFHYDKITLNFDYKIGEYRPEEIKAIYSSMMNMIQQILEQGNIKVKELDLISKEQRNNYLYKLNETKKQYPNSMIHELFERTVMEHQNSVALEYKNNLMTYGELNEKVNQLAHYLRERGIGPNYIVGVMVAHSTELIVSIMGILKAGGAYLPIDPEYPKERIKLMLEDSGSTLLITDSDNSYNIKFKGETINIKDMNISHYPSKNPINKNSRQDLAYVIYTSGSTGKPKGVMIEHGGLVNYIWWAKNTYFETTEESIALYSSIAFDLTVTSIFTPLISGNKMIIYNNNDDDEFVLYQILRENKTSVLKLTPAHLNLIKDMDNKKSKIKKLVVGGEELKTALAYKVNQSFGDEVEIYNEYGPTETVVGCVVHKYNKETDLSIGVPIGKPIDNMQIYILNHNLDLVQEGLVGELYISGDGVARGYMNREEQNLISFIKNPFCEDSRMYKTGDAVTYMEDGKIGYIGRVDRQISRNGFRIELGEIEVCILNIEGVKEAVVVHKNEGERNQLLAYIVTELEKTEEEIKSVCSSYLPVYMQPSHIVFIDQMPVNSNGKVDLDALPLPKQMIKEVRTDLSDMEKKVLKVIEEVVGVHDVRLEDDYSSIGGDSIHAILISSKLKEIGLKLKVKDILSLDSIENIVRMVKEGVQATIVDQSECYGTIEPMPITEWFFKQNFFNVNHYNQYIYLELHNSYEVDLIKEVFINLVHHHDGLRMNYDNRNRRLLYNDSHLEHSISFQYIELNKKQRAEAFNYKDYINRWNDLFDIEKSILFHLDVFQLDDSSQSLLFTAHHLVVDGISWRIMLEDFFFLLHHSKQELSQKTCSYQMWAEKVKEYAEENKIKGIDYWEDTLSKGKKINKIKKIDWKYTDLQDLIIQELDGSFVDELQRVVKSIYAIDLKETMIIGLALAVKNQIGMNEMLFELEGHGREELTEEVDISRTVGWFTTMYPVYLELGSGEQEENIKSLKEQILTIPNNGFDYGVHKYLNLSLKDMELETVRFNFLGDFDGIIEMEKQKIANFEFGLTSDPYNKMTAIIDMTAIIINKKLKFTLAWRNDCFSKAQMNSFMNDFVQNIQFIYEVCCNKAHREFTPSDFNGADISQEDLDILLNETRN